MQRSLAGSRVASSYSQAQPTAPVPLARLTQSSNGCSAHRAASQRKARALPFTKQASSARSLVSQRSNRQLLAQGQFGLPLTSCHSCRHSLQSQSARQSLSLTATPAATRAAACSRHSGLSSTVTCALQSQRIGQSQWLIATHLASRAAFKSSRGQKHRLGKISTAALQDVSPELTASPKHPWKACKRWLQNTFPLLRNEELLRRAAWTVMIIAIARLGLHLKLPYVNCTVRPRSDASGMCSRNH